MLSIVDPASRMHSTDELMSSAARIHGACNARIAKELRMIVSRGSLSASTNIKSHTRSTIGTDAHPISAHINHRAVKYFTASPMDSSFACASLDTHRNL